MIRTRPYDIGRQATPMILTKSRRAAPGAIAFASSCAPSFSSSKHKNAKACLRSSLTRATGQPWISSSCTYASASVGAATCQRDAGSLGPSGDHSPRAPGRTTKPGRSQRFRIIARRQPSVAGSDTSGTSQGDSVTDQADSSSKRGPRRPWSPFPGAWRTGRMPDIQSRPRASIAARARTPRSNASSRVTASSIERWVHTPPRGPRAGTLAAIHDLPPGTSRCTRLRSPESGRRA